MSPIMPLADYRPMKGRRRYLPPVPTCAEESSDALLVTQVFGGTPDLPPSEQPRPEGPAPDVPQPDLPTELPPQPEDPLDPPVQDPPPGDRRPQDPAFPPVIG